MIMNVKRCSVLQIHVYKVLETWKLRCI